VSIPGGTSGAGPSGPAGSGSPAAPTPRVSRGLYALAMAALVEPFVLIAAWVADRDLAGGDLLAIALVGGFFITFPALAIFGLAVVFHKQVSRGGTVPGLPAALTGPTVTRISATALVVSTLAIALVLALVLGAWSLVALPPLALSGASAWLMARAARR
jgi:hypothetical protein